MAFGFRFLLVQPNSEPADLTAIPSWKPGDEFLAGSELVRYRLVEIENGEPPPEFNGVFVVEPVDA